MMTRLLSRQAPWKLIGPMLFMLILGGCAGDQQQAGIQTGQTAEQEVIATMRRMKQGNPVATGRKRKNGKIPIRR